MKEKLYNVSGLYDISLTTVLFAMRKMTYTCEIQNTIYLLRFFELNLKERFALYDRKY